MKRASWDLAGTDDSASEAFNASIRAQALISGFGGLAQGEDVVAEAFDICRGELQLARSGVLRHVAAAVWRGLHPKTSLNLPTRCRVPPQLRPQASSLSHSLPDPERELRLMMPPLPGAESGREPRFPQALVWPWCGFEVAWGWLWCGLGVALVCWCKRRSVNCSSSLRLAPLRGRRSGGERSEPERSRPRRGAASVINWSRAGHNGFLLGCQQTHPKQIHDDPPN